MLDVVEHVVDPHNFLVAAAQFLKPDGTLIVSVPNVAHWTIRWTLGRGRFNYTAAGLLDVTHLRFFTRASIVELFEGAGYRVQFAGFTIGAWLHGYARLGLSKRALRALITPLCRRFPGLFAVQIVVEAQKRAG